MNLSSTIKSIQDIMRKDDGVDGDAQRIGQLTWMLFLKVFDQREDDWQDDARDKGETYVSPIPDECRWRNWAAYIAGEDGKKKPRKPGSELIEFVNNTLFPKLRELPITDDARSRVVRAVFEDSNNYMKSGTLLLGVIEKLDEAINFHDFKTRKNLGDLYEQLLNDLRSAGNAGEFYTPRAITQFIVERVNPSLAKREMVMDPACGTGGFLTAAIDHLRAQRTDHASAEDQGSIDEAIVGIEKKQLPHLLCTTNLLLHGIDIPSQVHHKNTLAVAWNDWSHAQRVACVVTNPPFGGMEDDSSGANYPPDLRTRETADMFMTLIFRKLLKEDGGRAGVVLPDGFLFGDGIKGRIKEDLLDKCNLHTIVRLPNGVFAPYTGIKTNLLFFTRGKPTETIWFYEHPFPSGQKSYSKTKPIRIEEFADIKNWWGSEEEGFASRVENERAWKIDFKTLKAEAKAQAQPHYDQAQAFRNELSDKRRQAKYLSDSLVGRRKEAAIAKVLREQISDLELDVRQSPDGDRAYTQVLIDALRAAQKHSTPEDIVASIDASCEELRAGAERLDIQARDAEAAGDRLYWPIYNLDLKNPNTPAEESHDPDLLLEKYKKLLAEIEETQEQLKNELAAALAHHFADEN